MPVTPDVVHRIAALARLAPDGDTIGRLTRDLNAILDHVAALERADVSGDAGGTHVPEGAPRHRDPSLLPDGLAAGAPASVAPQWRDGFFVVPRLAGMDAGEGDEGGADASAAGRDVTVRRGRGDERDVEAESGHRRRGPMAELQRTRPPHPPKGALPNPASDASLPPVATMAEAVRAREVEPRRWIDAALAAARADEDDDLGHRAFLVLAEPDRLPAAADPGASPSLAGVPVAVKDNLATLDLPTTCGSRILEGYTSPFEATVVRRLREAGAFVVGKTNMDEFAMGSSTENSAFGPTHNPRDRGRVPGGSSGGSAAAVAAGIVRCALGSDTGGSVRQPAALCGVVGIKPTYGRVSRYGLVAFASSLDQVGTFGTTVEDAALLLEAVAGHDPRDATSALQDVGALAAAAREGRRAAASARSLRGVTIGVPEEYFPDSLDAGVRERCDEALDRMRRAGAEVLPVSLPHTALAVPAYYVLAPAEASSNLARYDGVRYGARAPGADSTLAVYVETRTRGFGPEVLRRIMLGTFSLSAGYHEAYYGRAQRVRARIAQDFEAVWGGGDGVDLLFTPTSPTPAFRLGERTDDPVAMYLSDVFTVTANLAGLPGLSLPIGTVDGLPVGGQLLAPRWEEARMIRAAATLEGLLAGEAA